MGAFGVIWGFLGAILVRLGCDFGAFWTQFERVLDAIWTHFNTFWTRFEYVLTCFWCVLVSFKSFFAVFGVFGGIAVLARLIHIGMGKSFSQGAREPIECKRTELCFGEEKRGFFIYSRLMSEHCRIYMDGLPHEDYVDGPPEFCGPGTS